MNKKRQQRSRSGKRQSPVSRISVKPKIRLLLFVRSGGRCQFDGCNHYLLEHHLTRKEGSFGQMAHIVAFSPEGPRGKGKKNVRDVNDVDNLMLLCPICHKLIDDNPGDYSTAVLEKFKKAHEDRIHHVTGLGPDLRTSVLQLKAKIGGQTVGIPAHQAVQAVAPRYPLSRRGTIIDLTELEGEDEAFLQTATNTIDRKIKQFYDSDSVRESRHISVFALAPIALLVYLGSKLSNKVPTDIFQRHRDTEDWVWKDDGEPVSYDFKRIRRGRYLNRVALILSLSGRIDIETLPPSINSTFTVYEITLQGKTPNPEFLRLQVDLENFRRRYSQALSTIVKNHQNCREIHIFPAVPAPVAILCGREILPKVYPALIVYDNNMKRGGFSSQIRTNDHG